MRKSRSEMIACEIGGMVEKMDIFQRRLVFGLAFQGWEIDDWTELVRDFPQGWEFTA